MGPYLNNLDGETLYENVFAWNKVESRKQNRVLIVLSFYPELKINLRDSKECRQPMNSNRNNNILRKKT